MQTIRIAAFGGAMVPGPRVLALDKARRITPDEALAAFPEHSLELAIVRPQARRQS